MTTTKPDFEGLKPCPFCGGEAELDNPDDMDLRAVACYNCDIAIMDTAVGGDCITHWNTRTHHAHELLLAQANALLVWAAKFVEAKAIPSDNWYAEYELYQLEVEKAKKSGVASDV